MTKTVCILGTDPSVEGGIASIIRAYLDDIHVEGYRFEQIITHREGGKLGKLAVAARALVSFYAGLRAGRYDLVHAHASFGASFTRAYPFIRLAKRFGVPLIMHVHDSTWQEFYCDADEKKRSRIEQAYRDCAAVVVLAPCWRDIIGSDIDGLRIEVLENFAPNMPAGQTPQFANKTVLYIGRTLPFKGCDVIPQIAQACIDRVPEMRFIIAGDGSELASLKSACARAGLQDAVTFTGWIGGDEKRRVFGTSSVLLLPSEHEAMPVSILEAFELGMPVVASDVGGIPCVVHDDTNGYVRGCKDVDGFVEVLVRLCSDEALWERLSAGTAAVAESHSIQVYTEHVKELYDSIL